MIIKIIILIILIVINGIFSATEIAFLSLNKYEATKDDPFSEATITVDLTGVEL